MKKPTLELTWARCGGFSGTPKFKVEFALEPQREDSPVRVYTATLGICELPRCDCFNVFFMWKVISTQETESIVSRGFWFDIDRRRLVRTPEFEPCAESLRLSEILRTELTDAQQQELREWFFTVKSDVIRATSPSKIDILNLPSAPDGALVSFVEVFPHGLGFNFTFNGETWALEDQHCVQVDCDCTDTVLSFLKLRNAAGEITREISNPPAMRYNYKSRKTEPLVAGLAGDPKLAQLFHAAKNRFSLLDRELEINHLILRNLYMRQSTERLKAMAQAMGLSAKLGRNEPCPCGSGRKYKHCCLNKPKTA